ncbi:MAG: dTDP-4-dehydrorhamnose 3,5-epimerase [Vicinamibacterales bacterium]
MRVDDLALPGVKLVQPAVHGDSRGFFVETYHRPRYVEAGISDEFVQDNQSRSGRGTIRGLHLQVRRGQAKLVRVVAGAIVDVAVDVRVGSPSFGQSVCVELSAENFHQLYIPPGFAHGFAVVSEVADVEYKCSAVYDPGDEIAIRYDDPALGIQWPAIAAPILSPRDLAALPLDDMRDRLPRYAPR